MYDKAVYAGDHRLRAMYGSEMFAICKLLGYAGSCVYADIRVFAGEALSPQFGTQPRHIK